MSSSDIDLCPSGSQTLNVIRTLILDDSSFDRGRIKRMSRAANLIIDLTEVSNISELRNVLSRQRFDLILIDFHLPEGDGLDVLSQIKNSALNHDVAKIMITGEGDTQTAVTAMRNGCHDFLSKEMMTAEHLRSAVEGAMQTAQNNRDAAVHTAHQREAIKKGLITALKDEEVQMAFVNLFKKQVHTGNLAPDPANDGWELFQEKLLEDDEFIFK